MKYWTGILFLMLFAGLMISISPAQAQDDPRPEAELLAALDVPDDSNESVRQFMLAVKKLAYMGSEAVVAPLAAKLDNPRFSHYARFGLEPNPSNKADEAFFEALKTLQDGECLVGVINSIGVRKSPGAIEELEVTKEYKDEANEAELYKAAFSAIGALGSSEAALKLQEILEEDSQNLERISSDVINTLADACFDCGGKLVAAGQQEKAIELYDAVAAEDFFPGFVHEAAVYNAILARGADGLPLVIDNLTNDNWALFATSLKAVREIPGDAIGKTLLENADSLSPERKAMVIEAIADRRDKVVLPTLIREVNSDQKTLRLAAIRGLQKIGDASSVEVLLNAALEENGQSDVAKAAQKTLVWGPDIKEIDDAIVETLKNGQGPARTIAADIIEQRRITSAFPVLVEMTKDRDTAVRQAATRALGETIELDEFDLFAKMLADAQDDQARDEVKRAMQSASGRFAQTECVEAIIAIYEKAAKDVKPFLLELLSIPRGEKAVDFVASQAWVNDPELQDAATKVLGEWPDTGVAAALLKLARESRQSKYQIRGVRGYIRLARQFGMDEPVRIAMCKNAFEAARRDDDKILIFDIMPRYPSENMLNFTMTFFDTPFASQAYTAAVALADKLPGRPAAMDEALKTVIEKSDNADLKARAQRILER